MTSWARPVSPSASKSPKTITLSSRPRARVTRATTASASGRSPGSWRPAPGAPRNAASAAASAIPRRASTVAAKVPMPRPRGAPLNSGSTRRGSGNTQRWRGSVIASTMPRATHRGLARRLERGCVGRPRWSAEGGLSGSRRAPGPGSRRGAAAWASRISREALLVLPLVPHHEQRARVEDRRVGAGDDAQQQGEDEHPDRLAREQQQREQRDHDREAGRDRPAEGLEDRVIDDGAERLAGVPAAVLAHPVEHDDRVVDREADDRQDRGHEQAVDLDRAERAEDREDADNHQDVVEQRDEGRDAHLHVPEPVRDPDHDPDRPEQDQRERLGHEVGGHDRAYGRERLLTGDRPELLLEREPDLSELALGRKRVTGARRRGRAGHDARGRRRAGARAGRRGRAR